MNNTQRALFLGALVSASSIHAQTIHFTNGDSLEADVVRQTELTLTISHAILGRQTLDKAQISNLSAINLVNTLIVTEGDEGIALDEAYAAEKDIITAKQAFYTARQNLSDIEASLVGAVEPELSLITEQQVIAVSTLAEAESKLTESVDNYNAATDKVSMAKDVFYANAGVDDAKAGAEHAVVGVGVAQQGILTAENNVGLAENAAVGMPKQDAKANIKLAEQEVDIAEDQLGLAEESLETANMTLIDAENQLLVAKGEHVKDGFMGTGWFRGWDSSVELGLNGASGTTENLTFRTAFNTRYEDDHHRWDFKSFYLFDSANKLATENRVNASLVKDWFFKDTRWFAFAGVTYDWDDFKDWDHRLQVSAGPGYQFIKTKEWEFSARSGLTGIFEFDKTQYDSAGVPRLDGEGHIVEEHTQNLEAMIGADLTWHISAKQRFSASNYFYPSITNGGEFRNVATIDWIHDIGWFEGLALKFGIRDEYDTSESIPNEFKYNFSLLWGF